MLVFSRKKGQSLIIADNIVIKILDVSGDNVKVGIDAPRSIPVHREEVYQKIKEANLQAASSKLPDFNFLKKLRK